MSDKPELLMTGGGQCGTVSHRLSALLLDPDICRRRICQTAFGSFFAPPAGAPLSAFSLTRGCVSPFGSWHRAARGFCRNCGTPLTFQHVGSDRIAVSIGSLDRSKEVRLATWCGIEGRLSYFFDLDVLPGDRTTKDDEPEVAAAIRGSKHEHPDHDTAVWPPKP